MTESLINAPLDWNDIKKNTAKFYLDFKDATSEASEKQVFWLRFFEIFGIKANQVGTFEQHVKKLGNTEGAIDYFWPGKLIIEHKSRGKDLDDALQQAIDYSISLTKAEMPCYYIVSDFARIRLLNVSEYTDITIELKDLTENIELFGFIAGYNSIKITGQHPVNIKAAEKMGKLYDALKNSGYKEEYLDKYLVRLVFCLFAEDSGIFEKNQFTDHILLYTVEDGSSVGSVIDSIFDVVNTSNEKRQKALNNSLQKFPYVNGGLFAERLPIAYFDRDMRKLLIECSQLNWKEISPAIFGSLFQCVIDPQLRRELGAHYTSEENIIKVINPLFINDLKIEFEKIKHDKKKLNTFWDKLTKIKILDPACGCGNFLIISYRELKLIEIDTMAAIYGNQTALIKISRVNVDQFYGIEIEDFPAQIAQLAMWLMDHLMNNMARDRFGDTRPSIPLSAHAKIIQANSLTKDWKELTNPLEMTYIVGNPPFVGGMMMDEIQKQDISAVFGNEKSIGELDYVSGWYVKAADYITKYPHVRVAFVSTNSIVQGEQATILWKYLFEKYDIHIDFAYTTFVWNNEAKGKAKVHCVIIGFSKIKGIIKKINNGITWKNVYNINQYLVDARSIFVLSRSTPICDVPSMRFGSMPRDGGGFILSEDEKRELETVEPLSKQWIRPYMGSVEFINNKIRWCLWLVDAKPNELRQCPMVLKRIEIVRKSRENSRATATRNFASTPTLFCQIAQPDTDYIIVPNTSSQKRQYVPIGFKTKETIVSNSASLIPDASLYHFGILTSDIHMIWMRSVCGRLKSDYRYSKDIVYNTFPWPDVCEKSIEQISKYAQIILDVRNKYPDSSLADLYDPDTMPVDLIKAHGDLNGVVKKLYGFKNLTEEECLAKLLDLYEKKRDKKINRSN